MVKELIFLLPFHRREVLNDRPAGKQRTEPSRLSRPRAPTFPTASVSVTGCVLQWITRHFLFPFLPKASQGSSASEHPGGRAPP